MGTLKTDANGRPIQGFCPKPALCIGTKAANTVLKVGAGGDVDITGWMGVTIFPAADGNVEFNDTAAAVYPVYVGTQNTILIDSSVTQIKLSVESIVCGM